MSQKDLLLATLLLIIVKVAPQCSVERCCYASPCSNTYCQQKNSQTWVSTQNFANYGYTKLVESNSSCLPCPYNCKICGTQTTCSTCASGFYMSNGTCLVCDYMCASCVVVNGISKCSTCSGSTYLDSTTATCKNCPNGASVCSSSTVISSCQTGYHLTSNSLFCLACPSNCLSCPSSSSICTSCSTGYYLNSSLCYACTKSNCASCVFFSSSQYCVGCNTGYYATGGSCHACPSNCNACSGTTCNTCATGYYVSSGSCLAIGTSVDNCNTYSFSTTCSACSSGYYLSSNQCLPCSILCTTCTGMHFGACSSCTTNTNLFNQMCLPTSDLSSTSYQLYYSFPSAQSYIVAGSQDCNHYMYSGTTITMSMNELAGSQVVLKWRVFSKFQSSSYTVDWTNTDGTVSSSFTTSSSSGQSFPLCSSSPSTLYHLSIGTATITSVKISNTLTFTSTTTLALQQILVVITKCNDLCTECTDMLCTQCQMANLYTQDASCVYSCSSGYYIYTNSTSGQNSCVQTCPTGSYALSTNLSCVTCTSPCLTCINQNQCLSCVTNYYLTSENTCLQTCPYQYYGQILTQSCQKCVGRCNQCLDQTRCLSCQSGFYYASNNSCLDSCDTTVGLIGMYANLTTLSCSTCSSSCLNCIYESTYCTQCQNGSVFYNNSCPASCPTGYYSNTSLYCLACAYPCETCSMDSTNCTACSDSYLLNNSCLADCPVGYFQDNTGLVCTACDASCSQCIKSSTNCQSCNTGYYLFNSTCLSSCPGTYYPNITSLVCLSCVGSCHTCSNDTVCLSCSSNFLYNGSCVNRKNCPSGYYANIANLTCMICNSNCLTCQYSATRCTSCYSNGTLTLLDNYSCVSSCTNSSTYASGQTCVACNSPCLTCSSATACLSCVDGYMLSGTSCSTSCSAGYYFSTTTLNCQACSTSCLVCTSSSFCQKCQTSFYLKSLNSSANECVSSCGSQMYINLVAGSCSVCIYPCLDCLSNVECSSCQEGVLYQGRCVTVCPDTTYLDSGNGVCSSCGSNCLTCTTSATHCLTCQTSYFLSTIDNTCSLNCPSSTYSQNVTQQCLQCSSTCSACINSTYCTACIANRTYLYKITYVCLSDCPLGFFANTTATTCDSCDSKCLTCSGMASNCQSCSTGYYLVRLTVSSYDCVASCPSGYYQESSNCQACIFPCLTCTTATACTTCVTGTYFYSNTSACLLTCPSNSFLNTTAQTCTLCTSPCASCRSSTYCLSCTSGLYLSSGSCVATCPSSYYSDTTQICTQCTGLCKTCSSKYFCLSCLTGYLSNGYCYSSCPAGTYANLNISACETCLSPCLECTFSTSYCTRCTGGLVQYQGSCSASCPTGTYLSDGSCLSCQFPCISCNSASSCSECLGGYLLYNSLTCINDTIYCPNDLYKMDGKYCIHKASCPSTYYIDTQLKTCSSSCSASKYLSNSNQSCEYSCQSGQWVGVGMVCKDWAVEQPISLMTMKAVSFIASNIMNIVVSFNQSQTWMSGATNLYTVESTATARLLATTTGLQYNMETAAPTHLILKVASMPNKVSFQLPANYVLSSSTSYPLQNPNITLQLPAYVGYEYSVIYQGMLASQFGSGLGWFILLLTVIYLFKNRISHLYTLWDTVQLLYVIVLLEIQYPPALNQFLNGLRSTMFLGGPNMFSQGSERTVSSRPFYAYTHDNNFLRNAGPSLTLGIIVFIIYLFFKLVAELNKRTQKIKECMNNFPKIKRFVYQTLLRYRWHYASDVFFLTYLSVFLFAAAQIYNMEHNPGRAISNAACVISLILYLIFPIFAGVKLHRHFPNIRRGKHSENLRCFYRGIDKTSQFGVFLIMIRYFRKIVYALVIGIFSSRPMYALPILMFTSVLMALFIFLNLPFKKRLSNIVEIINQCSIALLFLMLALINFNNQQNYTGFNIALGYFCTGLLIFILLLLVFQVFVRSLFKLKSQEEIRKEQEQGLEGLSESQIRKKAGQFFDFMFPRLRNTFGLGEQSEEQSFNYEEGDSQDSENNMRRQQEWGINSEQEHHSDQFRHYGSETSEATDAKKNNAPDYLIRCVKQI